MQEVAVKAIEGRVLMGPFSDWRKSASAVRRAFRRTSSGFSSISTGLIFGTAICRSLCFTVLRDDPNLFISKQKLERAQGRPLLRVDPPKAQGTNLLFLVGLVLHILQIAPMWLPHERQGADIAFKGSQQRSSETQSSSYHWREIEMVLREEPDGFERARKPGVVGGQSVPLRSSNMAQQHAGSFIKPLNRLPHCVPHGGEVLRR